MLKEFVTGMILLSVTLAAAEAALPEGRMARAAGRVFALIFTAAVTEPIARILGG
ncbi:MAG: hypothetical protein J6P98_01465 [Clostridia bacterium]|nr:hypothetical protein [Clostridia bacterium]